MPDDTKTSTTPDTKASDTSGTSTTETPTAPAADVSSEKPKSYSPKNNQIFWIVVGVIVLIIILLFSMIG